MLETRVVYEAKGMEGLKAGVSAMARNTAKTNKIPHRPDAMFCSSRGVWSKQFNKKANKNAKRVGARNCAKYETKFQKPCVDIKWSPKYR